MQIPTQIPFDQLLAALLDADTPLNPRFLYRLSDLEGEELKELRLAWPRIPAWRRQALLEDVEELNESDMLLSFEALATFALKDEEPKVRIAATRTLWEYEEPRLAPQFLDMLRTDPDSQVRAAAASALARFVYNGELDKLPENLLHTIEEALLAVVNGSDQLEVRRAALESLGYSSRDEVGELIRKAFSADDKYWKASALFAMGRSANPEWQPQVMAMLESNLPLLRSEAARAAGELEIRDAVPLLVDLLDDPDENTRQACIWSLSQIGGHGVMELLQRLYEQADETELDIIESALDNLAFNEGIQLMPMFDLQENEADDDDGWYEEYDFENLEDESFEDADDEDDADEYSEV